MRRQPLHCLIGVESNFKAAKGFTLVELLVVIATIGVLAALLSPAISAAKKQAQRTTCLNNLRQINVGIRMYADDSQDASPSPGAAATSTNVLNLYSGYKALMKNYVGVRGSPHDKLFACPADTFYPDFVSPHGVPTWRYLHESLHDQPSFDFSSYSFNGGDGRTQAIGTNGGSITRPGLGGIKLSSVKHPSRTVLVAEASALVPWSWHEPSSRLWFADAKNMVSLVDGHVSYIKIYWDSTPLPGGGVFLSLISDPPVSYDYQWSPN